MDQGPRPATAELLDLSPHPEGAWFRETWRAAPESVRGGYPGPRSAATGIYFLLTAGQESAWHRVRSDEVWLWHSGGPLALLDGGDGDTPSGAPPVAPPGPGLARRPRAPHPLPARRPGPRSWSAAWWPPASTSPTSPCSPTPRDEQVRHNFHYVHRDNRYSDPRPGTAGR